MFTLLPFALVIACYVFTKLLRPVVTYLCAKGTRIVLYIDDRIVVGNGFDETTALSALIVKTLEKAGFVILHEKCANPM